MLYITLLDQFHPGIYSSQVIDVCDYLNREHKCKIRILAFLSIKELVRTDARSKLKKLAPDAIVLPSFPGLKNFEWTGLFLLLVCLFTGERTAICRNVFCTKMALRVKRAGLLKKVVMDGRSAMAAEIGEYDVFPVNYLRKNVKAFEKYAVNASDFRIAVSEKLITYWRKEYGYAGNEHVVIPCTLDSKFFNDTSFKWDDNRSQYLKKLGFNETDIVLVYSGSNAPWQSIKLLCDKLSPLMDQNGNIKLLFLSKDSVDISEMISKYNGRVKRAWVDHHEIPVHLQCCDYGILIRERSDTNRVASPVKFAEYLYAGLKVIISEELGDLSNFVTEHRCGIVLNNSNEMAKQLTKPSESERRSSFELAQLYFKKESISNSKKYQQLAQFCLKN